MSHQGGVDGEGIGGRRVAEYHQVYHRVALAGDGRAVEGGDRVVDARGAHQHRLGTQVLDSGGDEVEAAVEMRRQAGRLQQSQSRVRLQQQAAVVAAVGRVDCAQHVEGAVVAVGDEHAAPGGRFGGHRGIGAA